MDRVHISSAPFFFLASTFSLPSLEYNPLKETRRAIRNVIFVSFLFSWRSWIGIKYALFLSLSLSRFAILIPWIYLRNRSYSKTPGREVAPEK